MTFARTIYCLLTISIFLKAASLLAADAGWPQFRGPDGQGHAAAHDLPSTWSASQNIAWKTAIPGRGWSSPVIADREIWLTTAVETPLTEAEKAERLKSNTGNQPLTVSGRLSLRAVGIDCDSGKILRDVELLVEERPQPTHAMNSFASPTPVIEGGRLYCHFGTHGTACLETATGNVLWTNRDQQINHENGAGSSPVLFEGKLIFHCDGSDKQYIVALDAATGEVAWKTDRTGKMNADPQLKKAYGTPLIVEVAGQSVLFSPASDWLYGYEPATGRELWKMPYEVLGFSIVPRPVAGHGLVFMSTSFMQPQILAVKHEGSSAPKIAWRYARQAPNMCSPLLVGKELYLLSDKGIFTCLNALTGDLLWSQRLPGNYAASPLLADGKIFCAGRTGEVFVLAPGSKYEQLAVNQLDGPILASPAAVESALYVRTEKSLYRIEKR